MIQILGIRQYTDANGVVKGKDAFHDRGWRAPSVPELLAEPDKYLAALPDSERWNLYYTAANCTSAKRQFASQEIIPFDIDDILVPEDITEQIKTFDRYVDTVCPTLGIDRKKTGIVFSGNGLQLLVRLENPFFYATLFDQWRPAYKLVCAKINRALSEASLPGKADTAVWDAARLLRLPNTLNKKPGKPQRRAKVINALLEPVSFDLLALSGIPQVPADQAAAPEVLRQYPEPDVSAILSECEFLKWCNESPEEPDEPQLYAALSIIARFPDADQKAIAIFQQRFGKRNHGGTREDLLEKLEQASQASGPRTCKNIDTIFYGCRACKHFNKCATPIQITGPDFIKTAKTGFHDIIVDSKGNTKLRPNRDDLRRYFEKEQPYKMLGASRICYVYQDNHYQQWEKERLESYAEAHYSPKPDTFTVTEFVNSVMRNNLRELSWWNESTQRKINFQNGVLDIDTGAFAPHSPEYGFRYILPYDYNPNAQCPAFDKFLNEVMCGDPQLIDVTLEYIGYALSYDECWAQTALIFEGAGANGKSTLVDMIKALAGRGNYSTVSLKAIETQTDVQAIDGKLFNIFEEIPVNGLRETENFKAITSGGTISARQLYKNSYQMDVRAKMIFCCNKLPETTDHSMAYFRRFLIIPCRASFTGDKADRDIKSKMLPELPGIFNKVLAAYNKIKPSRKFTHSPLSEACKEDYRRYIDDSRSWALENICWDDSQDFSDFHTIYAAYREAMERDGLKPESAKAFSQKLAKLIPDYETRKVIKKVGNKATRVLRGVKIQNHVDEF